ncbi:hypothetical protein V8D89_010229 [Ganoderma adspersum]
MSPPCSETKVTTTACASSSNRDAHGGTTPNLNFKSKLIPVTLEPPFQLTGGSAHDFESPGAQVQENQRRGQAIVFGQPLDEDGVVPGLGLFLSTPSPGNASDTFGKKDSDIMIVKKFGSTQELENLPHSMLNPGLQSPIQVTVASHSESPMPMGIGLELRGDASSVPTINVEQTDSAWKLAPLKEERDAAMSTYKQKVKEMQWTTLERARSEISQAENPI